MIREYQQSDCPGVEALYEQAVKEWLDISQYPMAVYAETHAPLTEENIEICVVSANDAGGINGILIGGKYIGKCFFVYDFYVISRLRKTLVPGRMYQLFESLAAAKGYEHIIFETSPNHTNFIELLEHTGCKLCKLQFAKELNNGRRS